MCVCVYMDNLCWTTFILPVCTIAVAWLGTVWMLSCRVLCYCHVGMQVHANDICIFLSNRYENAVLSITITGYGGVAVRFGRPKLAVWTILKEDNEESVVFVNGFYSCCLHQLSSALLSSSMLSASTLSASAVGCILRCGRYLSNNTLVQSFFIHYCWISCCICHILFELNIHTTSLQSPLLSLQPQEWQHN